MDFGTFTVDAERAELRRGCERIPLRPKCFDLLMYLVSNAGRLVSKQELLDKVWAGVIVNEATLNRTVTELRAVLGDDADHPQYIETVSRRGYKFIAPVSAAAADVPAPAADFTLVHNDREFPLRNGEMIIGRGYEAAIPIFGSAASRQHARIILDGNRITLEDLGSRNGTFVNGKRVEGTIALHPGDEIRIGTDSLVLWSRSSETASLT